MLCYFFVARFGPSLLGNMFEVRGRIFASVLTVQSSGVCLAHASADRGLASKQSEVFCFAR